MACSRIIDLHPLPSLRPPLEKPAAMCGSRGPAVTWGITNQRRVTRSCVSDSSHDLLAVIAAACRHRRCGGSNCVILTYLNVEFD